MQDRMDPATRRFGWLWRGLFGSCSTSLVGRMRWRGCSLLHARVTSTYRIHGAREAAPILEGLISALPF